MVGVNAALVFVGPFIKLTVARTTSHHITQKYRVSLFRALYVSTCYRATEFHEIPDSI